MFVNSISLFQLLHSNVQTFTVDGTVMFGTKYLQFQGTPRLRLIDLNSDVIVNVLGFLKPHDIMSVRQVCISVFSMLVKSFEAHTILRRVEQCPRPPEPALYGSTLYEV